MATIQTQGFTLDNSGQRIVVDPITRIEGHLRIEADVDGGRITAARMRDGKVDRPRRCAPTRRQRRTRHGQHGRRPPISSAGVTAGNKCLFTGPGMAHCGGGEGPNTFDALACLLLVLFFIWNDRCAQHVMLQQKLVDDRFDRRMGEAITLQHLAHGARLPTRDAAAANLRDQPHAMLRLLVNSANCRHPASPPATKLPPCRPLSSYVAGRGKAFY